MADFDKLIVSFLVDEVVGGFFISVPPGHVACVYDRGRGVLPKTWGPGLHLKIPFWQVAKLFNARVLEYTIKEGFNPDKNPEMLGDKPIRAVTRDGKRIVMEGSILSKVDKNRANEVWENVGDNFVSKIIRPVSRSRIRSVLSELTYDEIVNHRTSVEKRLKEILDKEFDKRGLICEGFLLSDIEEIQNGLEVSQKDEEREVKEKPVELEEQKVEG